VDEVLAGLHREVAADRARRRVGRAGRADHRANESDGVGTLEHHRHDRARGDELDEPAEERALAVDRVVALGQVAIDLDELEPDDAQSALLEPGDDPAGQEALDAIGPTDGSAVTGMGTCCLRVDAPEVYGTASRSA
jgi:hypothetical protein